MIQNTRNNESTYKIKDTFKCISTQNTKYNCTLGSLITMTNIFELFENDTLVSIYNTYLMLF